jgi:hypothetical protein
MRGPSAEVDSSSGRSGTVAAPVSLLLLVALRPGAGSFAAVDADNGDEPALTLVEDLDYATECLLLTTVTSLAVRLSVSL